MLDHQILLSCLHLLGVRYLALLWFTSYLSDHGSSINIYHYLFSHYPIKYGIPQGSVLCPTLCPIYLYPLPSIISKYLNIYYHLYADDIHIYIFLPINSSPGLIINSLIVLMTLKNGLFLIIFYLMPQTYIVESFSISYLIPSFSY